MPSGNEKFSFDGTGEEAGGGELSPCLFPRGVEESEDTVLRDEDSSGAIPVGSGIERERIAGDEIGLGGVEKRSGHAECFDRDVEGGTMRSRRWTFPEVEMTLPSVMGTDGRGV